MPTHQLKINNRNNLRLSAKIEVPDGEIIAYAIFAHCFTCNKNLNAVRNISRALQSNNIAVTSFDFTGLGSSDGDFVDSSFSSNVQDIVDISKYLTEHYEAPKILVGHSLGGAAALFASAEIREIQAVATIGAPSSPQHLQHLFSHKIQDIKEHGQAMVNIAGRSFPISAEFLEDLKNNDLSERMKKLNKSLLIMHSPEDYTVDIQHASNIYKYASHPKSFISLSGADHLLSDRKDSTYAGNIIAQWASRYIQ